MKKGIICILLSLAVIFCSCIPYVSGAGELSFDFFSKDKPDTADYPCEFPCVFDSALTGEGYAFGEDILPALAQIEQTQTVPDTPVPSIDEEMRAVWVPYLTLYGVTASDIDIMVKKIKAANLNTVFFHVRPFGDALYDSDYYPWSHVVSGTQGKAPDGGFDPLGYAVEVCHKNGIKIHAWINPLRVQSRGSTPKNLSADNPAYQALHIKNPRRVIEYNDSLYYNPSNSENIILIVNGVREILRGYDVDGIHFDDYFYPADDESFNDAPEYSAYVSAGGTLNLTDWRCEKINQLVRQVYAAVKEEKSTAVFGISPAGNISRCARLGADIKTWCSQKGYVDYICPQIYWSQKNPKYPFEDTAQSWRALIKNKDIKLYIGLALYKAGTDSDENTWQGSSNIADQIRLLRGKEIAADGFGLYSYAYLDNEATAKEMENVKKVMSKQGAKK